MFMEVNAALNALNAIRQIASGLKQVSDQVKANEVLIAIQDEVLTAQQRVYELQALLSADRQTIAELREDARKVHATQTEREKYKLLSLTHEGQMAYFAKADPSTGTPAHWICQPCFDQGRKVVLQPVDSQYGNRLICSAHSSHSLSIGVHGLLRPET